MMIREPNPGRKRLADLRDRRRHLRTDLARHLLQGTPPPDRLPLAINRLRQIELELETGGAPAF